LKPYAISLFQERIQLHFTDRRSIIIKVVLGYSPIDVELHFHLVGSPHGSWHSHEIFVRDYLCSKPPILPNNSDFTCPSCQPLIQAEIITLDFRNTNDTGGHVGYRYAYQGTDYPANYDAREAWNCENCPLFFAAWNDVDVVVWLGTCFPIDESSIRLQTPGTTALPVQSVVNVPDAHQNTLILLPSEETLSDIQAAGGLTTILLTFSLQ
jgi:hypothetical protein